MKVSTRQLGLARTLSLGLSVVLVAGMSLFGATAAQATTAPRYAISGVVEAASGGGTAPLAGVTVSISFMDVGDITGSTYRALTLSDGSYSFAADQTYPVGHYTVNFSLAGYNDASVGVDVVDADVTNADVTMQLTPAPDPALTAGTAQITGSPVVGNVLTAATAGWPAGTTLTYQWYVDMGEHGTEIGDAMASSYTVSDEVVGSRIGVVVTGSLAGYSPSSVNVLLDAVTTAPKKPTAAGPTDLAGYLSAHGSTPAAQTSAGLPAGPLDPSVNHVANVDWTAPDSYVDVYIYSTPTLVGTFPVVNGVAQITLSKAVLATLSTGTHTLVITGQSSGAVQSVTLALGLAATGAESPAVPLTVASLLLLLGAGLLITRRRILAQQA